MEEKIAMAEISHIAQLNEDLKKEILDISNKMLTIFVDSMNGKQLVDVINIGVNGFALLAISFVQSISNDFRSQQKLIEGINHFMHCYHDIAKIKKEEL